ncbi:MAG: sulfite exporter TauE/SafE family protein [Chthonomonadales bacterium]
MTLPEGTILFTAAVLAGALNSVAGGGSFISFPALLYAGVPPIQANATNTVALWPGTVASVAAYRDELSAQRPVLLTLASVSLAGGFLGSEILLHTPERTFMTVLPFLMLAATLLFAFGPSITRRAQIPMARAGHVSWRVTAGAAVLQFIISVYGGYFGGGIGIVMLAMLAFLGIENIHAMNGLKTLLGALINGVAVAIFIAARAVYWPHAAVMVGGSILGGYFGAKGAQRVGQTYVRAFVIAVGSCLTVYFLWKL